MKSTFASSVKLPRKFILLFTLFLVLTLILSMICLFLNTQTQTTKIVYQPDASTHTETIAPTTSGEIDHSTERLLSVLQKLPPNDKVIATEKIRDEYVAVITQSNLEVSEESGMGMASAKIWIASLEDAEPKLIKEWPAFQASYLYDVDMNGQSSSYSSDYLDVKFSVAGEGPFGWTEVVHDYIDLSDMKVLASSSWVDNFGPVFSLKIHDGMYKIKFKAKNGCRKEYTDIATGLLVNNEEFRFVKPHALNCPVFGEGVDTPTLPGFGEPTFHGDVIFIPLPWGATVDIDLKDQTIQSEDFPGGSENFPEKYPLPKATSSTFSQYED